MSFFRRMRRKNARTNRVYTHKRKSAFGGNVATMEEVEQLNKKIKDREAEEFAAFEKQFDQYLDKHFPEEEK